MIIKITLNLNSKKSCFRNEMEKKRRLDSRKNMNKYLKLEMIMSKGRLQ